MSGEGLGASRRGYGSLFRDRVEGPSVASVESERFLLSSTVASPLSLLEANYWE